MSVKEAIKGGNRQVLIALRERLAEEIDACDSHRDLASLSRQLREVIVALGDEVNPDSTIEKLKAGLMK